ncbi:tetratricopeptide repeat protein [Sphingomonas sp.]|uniref:tetratricopeptide repeat protein n=1 Tax=Sphingomonas sp. TaxID=28214 RepID=UPI003F7208FD
MAEPFTLAYVAAICVSGLIGNRADATAVAGSRKLLRVLAETQTPQNHDVLRATHDAWLKSVQVMARLAEGATTRFDDHPALAALKKAVRDPALTEFRFDGGNFSDAELERLVRDIYRADADADADPDAVAVEAVIARVEGVMGQPLTEGLRAVFRSGHAGKRGWAATFQLFFAQAVKDDEAVFRILTFERLNEVVAFAEAQAEALVGLERMLAAFWQAIAAQISRIEEHTAFLVEAEMARRGAEIQRAGIDAAVLRIAERIAEHVDASGEALAELNVQIDDLLQRAATPDRGSNLDVEVEDALRRIDERALAGEFESADREADRAFREWEAREGERRAREQAIGLRFARENVRTKRLLRDAEGAAHWIARAVEIDAGTDQPRFTELVTEVKKLIESGRDRGINLDLEIACALASQLVDRATGADELGNACVWRGTALTLLGEREAGTTRLEEAVELFRRAVLAWTRERSPLDWAMAQHNLGGVLQILGARESGTGRLEEAVQAYHLAIAEWHRGLAPRKWAAAQDSLGNVLVEIGARKSSIALLEKAVTAFRLSLEERTQTRAPMEWAATQCNLGNVLQTLGVYEGDAARLDEAVSAFNQTLEVWTRESAPLNWATAQNKLGNALQALGALRRHKGPLEKGVAAYCNALEEWTRERVPLNWAAAQNNLGNTLQTLATIEGDVVRLEKAVAAYREALKEWTRERVPLKWAMTQTNLGGAVRTLGQWIGSSELIKQAVTAYRLALTEHTRDRVPREWAINLLSLNLGLALLHECGQPSAHLATLSAEAETARAVLIEGGDEGSVPFANHVIAEIDRIIAADPH